MHSMSDPILGPTVAACFLGVTTARMGMWRYRGVGPTWYKIPLQTPDRRYKVGYAVVYRVSDLKAFQASWIRMEARMPRPMPGRQAGGTGLHQLLFRPHGRGRLRVNRNRLSQPG